MIEQKIPLTEWGALHYKKPPSAYVLRQWARNGEIFPPPEKVGYRWDVLFTYAEHPGFLS